MVFEKELDKFMKTNSADTFISEVYAPNKINIGSILFNQINPPKKRAENLKIGSRYKLVTTYTSLYQSSIPNVYEEYPIIQIKVKETIRKNCIYYEYVLGYNGTGKWD